MENKAYFGSLTDRMKAFREEVLDEKPYIDAQRAVLATQVYRENQNQPRVMVRALMLQKILENMSIYIEDKTLIVGNQATKNKNAPIFPEYTMEFVLNELDLFEKRDGDVFYITEETKQQLRDIAPFWENNNLRARGEALLPEEVSVFMETGVFGMEGKLNAGDAHLAVNYEKILAFGLKGYEERVKDLKAKLDLTDPDSIDKNIFYKLSDTFHGYKRIRLHSGWSKYPLLRIAGYGMYAPSHSRFHCGTASGRHRYAFDIYRTV